MLTKTELGVIHDAIRARAQVYRETEALRTARMVAPPLIVAAREAAEQAEEIGRKLRVLQAIPEDFGQSVLILLRKAAEFIGDEADNRMEAGSHMSDYENEAKDALIDLNGTIESLASFFGVAGCYTVEVAALEEVGR